jgi:hypothetical protein
VASLQTVLTNWKNAATEVVITTQGGDRFHGIITDDGTVGDSILLGGHAGNVLIPKVAIATIPNL